MPIKMRTSDELPSDKEDKDDPEAALEACASDLIVSIHNKDVMRVAQILRDAFDLLESMPHEEESKEEKDEEPKEDEK